MTVKILLVDDDSANIEMLELLLSENLIFNAEFTRSCSGQDALKILKDSCFDLIISDLEMPNGDGYYLLKERLRLSIQTPVIIWSGHLNIDFKNLSQLGAGLFVSKHSSIHHNWNGSIKALVKDLI